MKKHQRPVFLAVTKYRYPITAIVSILHRISGVFIFLMIPCLLQLLSLSLASPAKMQMARDLLAKPLPTLVIWLIVAGLFFHLFAGIRHVAMDFGIGGSFKTAKKSSYIVFIATVIALLLFSIWLVN